jgi:hypothetical protein
VKQTVFIVGSFLAAVTLWIYGGAEPLLWYGSPAGAALAFSLLALLHVAAGFALSRGWAPVLALAAPVLAYPAGYADRGEWVIWHSLALVAPVGALLLFGGVAIRHVVASRGAQAA